MGAFAVLATAVLAVRLAANNDSQASIGLGRPFSSDDPFNTVVTAGSPLDPGSAGMVAAIIGDGVLGNMYQFAIPVTTATSATERYTVSCNEPPTWGICPLAGEQVPIPDDARPQPGSDGAMVVLDPANDRVFEFWQAHKSGDMWAATWGSVSSLSGSAWTSTATGSGASRLGGVIRISELQAGVIPHALAMQTSNACADVFVSPATKSDGRSSKPDCIPEGAHLQLDPTIDVAAISGLTKAERAIAVAMQTYGGFIVDVGGAKLSLSFEFAAGPEENGPGDQYARLGVGWDYFDFDKIPWERLRVLASSAR